VDPTLKAVSDGHYRFIVSNLRHYGRLAGCRTARILEVASYAHITGYQLQQELGCDVTLFDISAQALQLGRRIADAEGFAARPRLVAGDFHALPFEANSFDVVYISSALHHTWKYERVVSELQRVLGPGGLLLLLNEPCHRKCCFYGFRTNRTSSFTKFESVLSDLGVIRTFAEPYLGSRPETLFGMIENQKIPLQRLLDLLNSNTKIVGLTLRPEDCMGDLENSWLNNRHQGSDYLSGIIESNLAERRLEALKHFDEAAKGMRFCLPPSDQLKPFAHHVAQAICSLPPPSETEAFRTGLSEIFGAAVQIVAEKPGGGEGRSNHTLKDGVETRGDIIYAFDERTQAILLRDSSLLPDLQFASKNAISTFFPEDCWQYNARTAEGGAGIATLMLKSQPGRFRLPACRHQVLLVLRYYCAVPLQTHVRVRIQHGDRRLYQQQIWQSESFLWVTLFPSSEDIIDLELFREVSAANGEYALTSEGLAVAFVGAFEIK